LPKGVKEAETIKTSFVGTCLLVSRLTLKALSADPSAFNGSNDVSALTEELRIPGAPELQFVAHRKFPYIPDRNIETDAVNGHIVQVHLYVVIGCRVDQNFTFLLFSIDLSPIKVTVGNFPTLLTADGSPAYFTGDGYQPPSLT